MPFSPSDLSGLKLWFKADAITGLNDGDAVGTWPDSSGAGRDATQGTAGNKPTFQTNEINSLPVVRFDGTDDRLETASILGSVLFTAQQCTIFLVQKQDGTNAKNCPFTWSDGGANGDVRALLSYDDVLYWDYPTWGATGRISVAQPSGWDNAHHITCLYRDTNVSRIYVDGGTPLQTGTPSGSLTLTSSRPFVLGSQPGPDYFDPFKGDIAEVIQYNRTLTDTERDQVGNYLQDKYGLAWAGAVNLAGTAAGTSTVLGNIIRSLAFAGSAAGIATAAANLSRLIGLNALASGGSTGVANLSRLIQLAGLAPGSSTTIGALTVAATVFLAGLTAGGSTALAALKMIRGLQGSSQGSSIPIGTLSLLLAPRQYTRRRKVGGFYVWS